MTSFKFVQKKNLIYLTTSATSEIKIRKLSALQ